MFLLGVTSHVVLDMSSMVPNDKHVRMISENGTCFEHCCRALRAISPTLQHACSMHSHLLALTSKCVDLELHYEPKS
jgi:hypothetical protein